MSEVPPELLEWRRKTGADCWDEVWDGVLHMVPSPTPDHQRVETRLAAWLSQHWAHPPTREVLTRVNVSRPGIPSWIEDYRIPDLVLVTERAAHLERASHFEGCPDVVVEIRSPSDETDDKLAFYAAFGCREIWVIDRDSRACRILAVEGGTLRPLEPDAEGWLRSDLGVELRSEGEHLALRLHGDDGSRGLVP